MDDTVYDRIKAILAEQERLFTKLLKVAHEYDAIDFDESGFYEEAAARCERHWNTLAAKVAAALREGIDDADIRLLKNSEPNIRVLQIDVTLPGEEAPKRTRLNIDYAAGGALCISREPL